MRQESPQFKTIISDDTRNPTTKKKEEERERLARVSQGPELKRRSYSLNEEIKSLKQQLNYYCGKKDYRRVQFLEHRLNKTRSELSRESLSRLKAEQRQEKQNIQKAYQREIKHFQSYWKQTFKSIGEWEKSSISVFKKMQAENVEKAKQKINRKCNSLRQRSAEIIEIQKKQSILKKLKRWSELQQLNKAKKHISKKIAESREKTLNRWVKVQESQLNSFHTKRYNNLMLKLFDNRKDEQRRYLREQRRLKQKYKNVIRVMEHEQKMQIMHALDHLEF